MKRNKHTTNARRQMQRETPHQHWRSNADHVQWQQAVRDHGIASDTAQALRAAGIIREAGLMRVARPLPESKRKPKVQASRRTGATGQLALLNLMRATRPAYQFR